MKRFYPLFFGMGILLALLVSSVLCTGKRVVCNYTDSLPHGIYLICRGTVKKGDIVVFRPTGVAAKLIGERHYLRPDGFLMKHVAGLPGDSVCADRRYFRVAGTDYGERADCDSKGRPLPAYRFCGRLKVGIIVASWGMKNSFDSRYFGPVERASIVGIAKPLWIF